jgi:hypothetical protein
MDDDIELDRATGGTITSAASANSATSLFIADLL